VPDPNLNLEKPQPVCMFLIQDDSGHSEEPALTDAEAEEIFNRRRRGGAMFNTSSANADEHALMTSYQPGTREVTVVKMLGGG
jgi:hypothetical protein